MRDVNYGWLIRYTHANVASFFFIFLYLHMAKGLYYGSYMRPRVMLWSIGVIIFVLTMATGFLGKNNCPKWLIRKLLKPISYFRKFSSNNEPKNPNDIRNIHLPVKPVKIYYNALESKNDIINEYKEVTGIYLWHNNINGKQYIGSGYGLSKRLSDYYFPSKLRTKQVAMPPVLFIKL